jgi:hypothetical protein
MAVPRDPLLGGLGGPLPPPDPRDPTPTDVQPPLEREEDPGRDEHELTATGDRALTDEEKEAAEHDPGRAPRTYAPASERVPKEPIGGDRDLIEEGLNVESTADDVPFAGDRSTPEELR